MDPIVIIIALFAVIVVAAFLVYRSRARVHITGPAGTSLDINATNDPVPPTPAVVVKDAKSSAGGLVAEDNTGRGVNVEKVEVKDDILATSTPPKQDPKA
jgi:hypothetical protein